MIQKISCFLLTIVFIVSPQLYSQSAEHEQILKYIKIIETDPLGNDADKAAGEILKFATDSEDVEVRLSSEVIPFLDEEDTRYNSILIASFIAGNIKPQLINRAKGNDAYSGILLELATYEKIRQKENSFKINELEKMIVLKKNNKLKEYVDSISLKNQ